MKQSISPSNHSYFHFSLMNNKHSSTKIMKVKSATLSADQISFRYVEEGHDTPQNT